MLRYLLYRTFKDLFLCEKFLPPRGCHRGERQQNGMRSKGGSRKHFWGYHKERSGGAKRGHCPQDVYRKPLREPALHVFFIWPVGGDVRRGGGNTILTDVRILLLNEKINSQHAGIHTFMQLRKVNKIIYSGVQDTPGNDSSVIRNK